MSPEALDSAEHPNEMLDYSCEQMLDHLTKVRQALVEKELDEAGSAADVNRELAAMKVRLAVPSAAPLPGARG